MFKAPVCHEAFFRHRNRNRLYALRLSLYWTLRQLQPPSASDAWCLSILWLNHCGQPAVMRYAVRLYDFAFLSLDEDAVTYLRRGARCIALPSSMGLSLPPPRCLVHQFPWWEQAYISAGMPSAWLFPCQDLFLQSQDASIVPAGPS
uniref:WGS project CBMI000000000 data, contig CS3069_c001380 n=1 Tax=Fusarium clavum TaxID=2594811 RepID=A0A090MBP2_9HYPO|nr:unnamed protein product [Fusarium clavum]